MATLILTATNPLIAVIAPVKRNSDAVLLEFDCDTLTDIVYRHLATLPDPHLGIVANRPGLLPKLWAGKLLWRKESDNVSRNVNAYVDRDSVLKTSVIRMDRPTAAAVSAAALTSSYLGLLIEGNTIEVWSDIVPARPHH